jgi:hypothetical protein
MSPIEEVLLRLPVISLLLYVPFVCYADLKWRQFLHSWWIPLWAVNVPIIFYFYRLGFYPIYTLPVSLIMAGIFWAMHQLDFIQGADLIFLWSISLFFVAAPLPVPHGGIQPLFCLYLAAAMIFTAPVVLLLNLRRGTQGSLLAMMTWLPGGVPMALPISAALIMTVVLG